MATVTEAQPGDALLSDLRFAWEMVRHVKSNAIVLCKNRMLLGTGAGQMSRVDSTEIAIKKAGDRVEGSVLGSDAFFPFPDSIERAAAAGVAAIDSARRLQERRGLHHRVQPLWDSHDFHRPAAF